MATGARTPTPTAPRPELTLMIPYSNQTAPSALPTRTRQPTPLYSTPEVFPAWVAEFSDPLLKALAGQYPAYSDDFPPICISNVNQPKIKACSTPEARAYYQNFSNLFVTARPTLDLNPDLQEGYAPLNTGWFFDAPDTDRNPQLAHIEDGALILKLPEGKLKTDLQAYNPNLRIANFVLLFEMDFMTIEPADTLRVQFNQSADENFALDISRDQTWTFRWGKQDNPQAISGAYKRFTPEYISVVIIARGTECAAYFNHDPLVYVENCRAAAVTQSSKKAVSFHLLGKAGYESVIAIDNVAIWDLDKIH